MSRDESTVPSTSHRRGSMTAEEVEQHLREHPDADLSFGPLAVDDALRIASQLHQERGILATVKPTGYVHVYCRKPRQH
jgi:hypothetical protein